MNKEEFIKKYELTEDEYYGTQRYTKKTLEQQKIIKSDYPELEDYQDMMMGNFSFTKNEVLLNIHLILKWIEQFPEYKLMNQSNYDFDKSFYLTDTFE